jgi:hypothetical protein
VRPYANTHPHIQLVSHQTFSTTVTVGISGIRACHSLVAPKCPRSSSTHDRTASVQSAQSAAERRFFDGIQGGYLPSGEALCRTKHWLASMRGEKTCRRSNSDR